MADSQRKLANTEMAKDAVMADRRAGLAAVGRSIRHGVVAIRHWLAVVLALVVTLPVHADFDADLAALTRDTHRLSGSDAGQAAAQYLEQRLIEIVGEDHVFPLDMVVWQTQVERCELVVGGKTIPLRPMRPNIVVPPVTGPDGLTAPLMWVGEGGLAAYGDRSPEGRIVVLDYDSYDHWETAFAMGAKAVIFIGDPDADETPMAGKTTGLPANLLRFYVSADDLEGVDLAGDAVQGTIHSAVTWQQRVGRNLIAHIPGTDPYFTAGGESPESLVLAAHYDTLGAVPTLSPGARAAANVAAVLEAAEAMKRNPPRRDVVIMLVDNQSRYHQGAREVYDALMMTDAKHGELLTQHQGERDFVAKMRLILESQGLTYGRGIDRDALELDGNVANELAALTRTLQDEADYFRDDLSKALQVMRLNARQYGGEAQSRLDAVEAPMVAEMLRWDDTRRELHNGRLAAFVDAKRELAAGEGEAAQDAQAFLTLFDRLRTRTLERFDRRLAELDMRLHVDDQRAALRSALANRWIALHVTFNFSGEGATWGVVLGDWTNRLFASFRQPKPEGDQPGYYGQILGAFRDVVEAMDPRPAVEPRTLTDPSFGVTFAPGPFFSSGYVAGAFGIYHASLMTGYDARVRDGHPADTVDRLAVASLRGQAHEAAAVLARLADSNGLSQRRVFKPFVTSKYPSWSDGRSTGDYVGLQVTGSLSENRPGSGAMIATWPGVRASAQSLGAWEWLREARDVPQFQPVLLEAVDSNGRFRVIGYQKEMQRQIMTLAARFDERGRVVSISSREHQAQNLGSAMRIDMFAGQGYAFASLPTYPTKPNQLKVLRATANAEFRPARSLLGQLGSHSFFYVSDYVVEDHVKIFQPMGPVALGAFGSGEQFGAGLLMEQFLRPPHLSGNTAESLWRLNEQRLSQLRARGVTSADLELLHSRSKRQMELGLGEDAGAGGEAGTSLREREGALQRSAALSQRVYAPLRAAMDDLVHAIVLLLLLAIPFAFALERLLVCATTIYGRIAGFTVFFLITFGLLYFLHPGFAIASTPIIIFLAFAIILLSSLVIYIVVRKFKVELKAIQGQAVGLHDQEVSHTGTLLAAVSMGMSTMRRRPTRTTLTAVTVVMLTFTILCFASFSRTVGVRSIYEGPRAESTAPGLLLRKLDYSAIPTGVLTMLAGKTGADGFVGAHWWVVRQNAQDPAFSIARPDNGDYVTLDGIMGIPVEEVARWPELANALGDGDTASKQAALRRGEVFLPAIVESLLEIKPGQPLLINGRRTVYAGPIRGGAMQNLKHLDGESVIPVDFQTVTLDAASGGAGGQSESELLVADDVEKDFVHLSSDQIIVTSSQMARQLGGSLHLITVYPGTGETGQPLDVLELGREVARVVVMPVWAAGREGVERLLMTVLTEVSGGLALAVPLLLGGLIIFGTLLGSISDREKEIYTFSALGLSPAHVGVLFFAEATVYAVVGGMGGQLLAQFVALGAGALARAGYIAPASINYSSTNALFAIGVVMATVIISAIYPAMRASRSANPGLARSWKMPPPENDDLKMVFPFTVSAYDITGVISFLAEHFRRHDDAGLGSFAASNVAIRRSEGGNLQLESDLALAPFDLGVTQHLVLTAMPSEIEGIDEVGVHIHRLSGARGDWIRANSVFMRDLRKQFLLWRTLSNEMIEEYRMQTLETLGGGGRS